MSMIIDVTGLFVSLMALGVLLLIGQAIRSSVGILRAIFLPTSIIAGFIGLLIGPQALGALITRVAGPDALFAGGLLPPSLLDVWSELPVLLINVVFAALFLGKAIPGIREIWSVAGPVITYGQTVAWGQYVVGLLLALLILTPVFGLPPEAGALIEIGFEGGHGTAAGLSGSFEALGFAEAADLALGLATVGVVMGVVIGVALVNRSFRSGQIPAPGTVLHPEAEEILVCETMQEQPPGEVDHPDIAAESLSIHLGVVSLAIIIGWVLLQALIRAEAVLLDLVGMQDFALMHYIPLFPLAMIGGLILQVALERLGRSDHLNRPLINRISGTALDVLILAAIATLSLTVIGEHLVPFLILAAAGVLWNVGAFLLLAPRLIPEHWFARGIPNFGQSMGMTATGLLLSRMTDPNDRARGVEGFGYKQLLFEPVVGGGLFTAASMPLIVQFGPVVMLLVTAVVMAGWLIFGLISFGRSA
ncbi:MAG: sodium/glutamate symporter [Methanomicrobiaceae archaeon]|nr:sodium/glutamate symporter [Methanomicrobiaceae archaeon]